jgi:hypothetical protein
MQDEINVESPVVINKLDLNSKQNEELILKNQSNSKTSSH